LAGLFPVAGGVGGGEGNETLVLASVGRGIVRTYHQPMPAATAIRITISGQGLRRRAFTVNGVPISGASPKRRRVSDFFNASRIRDMFKYQDVY